MTPPMHKSPVAARSWVVGGLIIVLTVLAYLPVLHNGYIWDDDDYVTQNMTLHDLAGLKRIWTEVGATPQYYPLVFTTFWLECHIWGLNATGYHVVNVLLHALGAMLLWRVMVRLGMPGAGWAAAIFALHPAQVESVAWITERKNVLSGVFYFASALAWMRFTQKQSRDEGRETRAQTIPTLDSRPSTLDYILSLFFFLCALLSKTVTCSLPAALLLVVWWKKGKVKWRDVLPLAPFFVMGVGLGWHTALVEKQVVRAVGAAWELSFPERLLIAGRALWFYAAKLAWPTNLTFIYPRWEINAAIWWQWIFPAAAVAAVTALWFLRKQIGRGPLVGVLFFAGTLFPALGFVDVYPMRFSFVADHFQYLAGMGLIGLAAAGLTRWSSRFHVQRALVILPLGLAVLTWQQTRIYHDPETLWRDTLAKNPASWMAHQNLAVVFLNSGRLGEAETQYRAALKLKPDNAEALNDFGVVLFDEGKTDEAIGSFQAALRLQTNFMEALGNLGDVLAGQKRFAEAVRYYEAALQLKGSETERRESRIKYNDSLMQKTRIGYGVTLMEMGRLEEAIGQFHEVLLHHPENPEAHFNLGNAFAAQGRDEEAMAEYTAALRFGPKNAEAHNRMGLLLARQGRDAGALEHYEAALRIDPKDIEARHNLGVVLGRMGRLEEAIEQFREVLKVRPDYAAAHDNLGLALAKSGHIAEATVELRDALQYAPSNAETHLNLGNLLALQGNLEGAVAEYRETLRLSPGNVEARFNLGRALADLGRREEAIEQLREVLKLEPEDAEAKDKLRTLEQGSETRDMRNSNHDKK